MQPRRQGVSEGGSLGPRRRGTCQRRSLGGGSWRPNASRCQAGCFDDPPLQLRAARTSPSKPGPVSKHGQAGHLASELSRLLQPIMGFGALVQLTAKVPEGARLNGFRVPLVISARAPPSSIAEILQRLWHEVEEKAKVGAAQTGVGPGGQA